MSSLEPLHSSSRPAQVERRSEHRDSSSLRLSPVNCILVSEGLHIPLEVINCHYRGASFRASRGDFRCQHKKAFLLLRIGETEVSEEIAFRVVWETIADNGAFGVEFLHQHVRALYRAERFATHNINAPIVSAADPLDPNRTLYLRAINASTTGMLLSTSLTNKHVFPGMQLRGAVLEIANIGKARVDLVIENSRAGGNNTVHFGVSVIGQTAEGYRGLISKYLSTLGDGNDLNDQRLEKLARAGLVSKQLKSAITIREVQTEQDYEDVLKLRFEGYGKAGKAKSDGSFLDMGEGLRQEGVILAAYISGQMIASVELRFSGRHPLRISEHFDLQAHPYLSKNKFLEVNKLVVSPTAQRSDVVVGIFQKIHALAILNGKLDGLLVAEDNLVRLYRRLGAKKIGLSYPHPVKANTNLHVMCIPRETYEKALNINPFAWAQLFALTQEFLSNAGLAERKRFSWKENAVIVLTRCYLVCKKWVARNKRGRSSVARRSAARSEPGGAENHPPSDPKWTRQQINTSVFLPYLLVADEMIGATKVNAILCQVGIERSYLESSSNWISVAFFDFFVDEFAKLSDVEQLQERAGYRNLSKEILGINHFVLKHFLSPVTAFRAFGAYLPKFNKTRTYQILESSSTHCRIRVGVVAKDLVPKDRSAELNWKALLDAYILSITGQHGKVQQVKSIYDGEDCSEYIVRWTNPFFRMRTFVVAAICTVGGYALATLAFRYVTRYFAMSGLIICVMTGLSCFFFWKYREQRRQYAGFLDSLTEFQKEADARYCELQSAKSLTEKNFQESLLLEEISREIQSSEDLTSILNNALNALCTKLELQRALAMTVNDAGTSLHTTAMFGAGTSANDLWKFNVDVSVRRDDAVVLSSVFHSGQSILITDVDEHKFHLNPGSRRLIDKLETKGFAMVPIPSESKNWGVLIADKGPSANVISQRDLLAIQRVAQAIGLALDKKARIENEMRIRRIFQKYAPSAVIAGTLGSSTPKLGGQVREAVCLFLDIRRFTALSFQLPPEILCELLNDLFNIVQRNVINANGVIDKFLGDGALVTWGAVPGSLPDPELILGAARCILRDLARMNARMAEKGMTPIEVGIGIHKGPVIAGNIGSHDRMEFTVVGNTVNVASRLEQLTKTYACHVVISESLMPFDSLTDAWTVHHDVVIRGLDAPIRVATLSFPTTELKSPRSLHG